MGSRFTTPALVERLEWCGVPAYWGWGFCRTAGCQRCRNHRRKVWVTEAVPLFADSRRSDLHMVTVMLAPASTMESVAANIKRGKVAWRNLVFRLRQTDERGKGMRILGAAEIDWYQSYHVERLSGYKLTQLQALGFDATAEDVWFPHFHLIVDLAGYPEGKFRKAVERQWPGYRQTDIQRFDDFRTVEASVARIINYATKHKHFYKIDPYRSPAYARWSDEAIAKYYNQLFMDGGFASLRFHLKPVRVEPPPPVVRRPQREPMPCLF